MRRTSWLIRGAVLAVLLLVGVGLRLTVYAPQPPSVRTARVERGVIEETVTNSRAGTVRARRRAKLSPETGGRVVALPFRKGQRVRAGEVMLRLDDATQRGNLELARRDRDVALAQREEACLTAEHAKRERERTASLAADGIAPAAMLDQASRNADSAAATCQALTAAAQRSAAAIALAEVELKKTVLVAPFDGLIADVMTELGEWVTPSPPAIPIPPVLDIVDTGAIYITAPIDEVDSTRVRIGQTARISVDSFPGRRFEARITRVAPYVADRLDQNRTVDIEAELVHRRDTAACLPGTSADVEVVLSVREDAVRLPTAALLEGRKVLVVENGRLVERLVKAGVQNWDYCEIRAGVRVGEEVVVSMDGREARAGMRVRVAGGT